LLCPNFRRLPLEKSCLATEVIMIRKLLERFSTDSVQKRLTATNMTWIVSENVFAPCDQQNGASCSCKRVQELSKTCHSKSQTLGEPWDHGAIIFGAKLTNRLRKEGRETGKRQERPCKAPEAISSLMAATAKTLSEIYLPSTPTSPNGSDHSSEKVARKFDTAQTEKVSLLLISNIPLSVLADCYLNRACVTRADLRNLNRSSRQGATSKIHKDISKDS
jgi:hypothetical protein